jgi:tight adherence protein C
VTPALAGLAGLLLFASAWELAGFGVASRRPRWARRLRLERAVISSRGLGALGGAGAFALVAPVAPGRLAPLLAIGLVGAGALVPEAYRERLARRRRARLVAALPDALDLLAVGAAAGRSPTALFAEISTATSGPLAEELAITVAEIDTGIPLATAVANLRRRAGAPELGALGSAIERSQSYGSPLADQLHAQAAELRRDERRRVEERAARAAPKIQLVVALLLVPSALLAIAAALVAHADAFFQI